MPGQEARNPGNEAPNQGNIDARINQRAGRPDVPPEPPANRVKFGGRPRPAFGAVRRRVPAGEAPPVVPPPNGPPVAERWNILPIERMEQAGQPEQPQADGGFGDAPNINVDEILQRVQQRQELDNARRAQELLARDMAGLAGPPVFGREIQVGRIRNLGDEPEVPDQDAEEIDMKHPPRGPVIHLAVAAPDGTKKTCQLCGYGHLIKNLKTSIDDVLLCVRCYKGYRECQNCGWVVPEHLFKAKVYVHEYCGNCATSHKLLNIKQRQEFIPKRDVLGARRGKVWSNPSTS